MSPPSSIAHYRLTAKLGEGGMGAVYRATDTKLHRDVAVKVLPDSFGQDPDRMARFERESHVLASLNHPNIAAIHGVEERAIVMELVEGNTLSGPMPLEEALPIIHQLIDALEYAHEKGVIHRDLKPANIKVTPEGRVKILDFGLAKALSPENVAGDPASSPTLTMRATIAGVMMGTAAYMAPEQARGQSVDKRADIWAFGVVLYEMVTGRQLFSGETVSDTIAAVLRQEPDLERVPPRFRRLIGACLVRDPRQRLRDISGAKLLLEAGATAQPAAPQPPAAHPSRLPWLVSAALLLALAVVSSPYFRPRAPEVREARFIVPPPEGASFNSVSLSPDGQVLVFSARDKSGNLQLWLRHLHSIAARPIAGTDDANFAFWSPDSRFVAFVAENRLKRVDISGGPPQVICPVSVVRGGTWNRDGLILFATAQGLLTVPAAGGEPKLALARNAKDDILVRWPTFLPDGRHFLFTILGTEADKSGVYLSSLGSPERIRLLPDDSHTVYTQDRRGRGFLLFSRDGTLMAQDFDPHAQRTTGEAFPVAEQVYGASSQRPPGFSASTNASLVYLNSPLDSSQLTWFDRSGKRLAAVGERSIAGTPRLSPDGKRIVTGSARPGRAGDLYIVDGDRSQRFTFNRHLSAFPVWSPDGEYIIYCSNGSGVLDLMRKAANGTGNEELLLKSPAQKYPTDISPDGKFLVFTELGTNTNLDIWILPLSAGENKPVPFLQTPSVEQTAAFSPDGKWIAYTSDESGRPEVYLRPFSPGAPSNTVGGQRQVSRNGGHYARWRGDGRELYYWAGNGKVTAVPIDMREGVQIGTPQELFPAVVDSWSRFAVTPDGQRFLFPAQQIEATVLPATVVLNWTAAGDRVH
jgi:eukaryotic-like serine/threonine-protein kinase